MRLSDFFVQKGTTESTHDWDLVSHDSSILPIDALAELLADKIMEERCQNCPDHYRAWKQRLSDGTPLSATSYDILTKGFIKPAFGLPNATSSFSTDHLEGLIAQYIWYFLSVEITTENIERIERPGFAATDHGADGMIIHREPTGHLMFRLWEIKKNTGRSSVGSTVTTAYDQLKSRVYEYLARYTVIGQELPDPELKDFYGQLPDLWASRSHQAAVGVAVASDLNSIPARCFTTFGDRFPDFLVPKRLKGMLTAIEDFSSFSEKMQKTVWKGL